MAPEAALGSGPLPDRLEALAQALEKARRANTQIADLPRRQCPLDEDEAYWVNRVVADRLRWAPLGWKIAGTTEHVRRELNLAGPIYGRSFKRFSIYSPAELSMRTLLDPMVECEFFVTLSSDLPPRDASYTIEDIYPAIASVHAGIEIAEVRFPLTSPPPMTAVLADGSATGHYVTGSAIENWRDSLRDVEVVLEIDGEIVARGTGADVMGDPLLPIAWLANERSRWGDGLKAGEVISTGSTTGIIVVRAGQRARATFGGSSQVEIAFLP